MTTAWQRFLRSLGTEEPRELTYDVAALRELGPSERVEAGLLLGERIRLGDVRAIETALAAPMLELASAVRALPPTAPGPAREAAARALARFGDAGAVGELAARLAHGHAMVRINAAYELSKSDEPAATAALLGALEDDERIVRVHAWNGLVRHFGVTALTEPRHGPLGRLFALLCSRIPAARARGVVRIRAVCGELAAGTTPTALGLDTPVPPEGAPLEAFIASVRDKSRAIDVDAIRAMDPHQREWAVIMTVSEHARDPVRPRVAVAELGEAWAMDAIDTCPDPVPPP